MGGPRPRDSYILPSPLRSLNLFSLSLFLLQISTAGDSAGAPRPRASCAATPSASRGSGVAVRQRGRSGSGDPLSLPLCLFLHPSLRSLSLQWWRRWRGPASLADDAMAFSGDDGRPALLGAPARPVLPPATQRRRGSVKQQQWSTIFYLFDGNILTIFFIQMFCFGFFSFFIFLMEKFL